MSIDCVLLAHSVPLSPGLTDSTSYLILFLETAQLPILYLFLEPLDESERGEWKVGLRLNIQKTKIMASGLITSWQIDGETMEAVRDFIVLGSKITADDDRSH